VRPPFQVRKKRPVGRIVLALVALAGAATVAAGKLRPVPVTTTPVVRGTAIEAVYATGTVEPFDRVIVKAKAAGSIDLKVREGATVKKGDLLATIDSATLRHELERGRADLWAASQQATSDGPQLAALEAQARSMQAEMNTIQSDRARTARLVSSGAVPQADLDRIVDRAASLQAQLDANAAQRKSLRIDLTARATGSSAAVDSLAAKLADAEVRAPIDGIVLARFVEPGEVAMVNSPLVKIGTADNLILECAIDEADIGKVTIGKPVAISLYAFPQTIAKGEVFEILPDADRVKKSFLAKVRFVDPPVGLRSGMTAEANVVIEEHPSALLAPGEAVDSAGTVFLAAGGRVHRLTPRLGVRDMLRVEVLDGLREGDQVVVSGSGALQEGKRVHATVKPPFEGVIPSSVTRSKMSL
jgi:multidrug efflux pump subunit AcrA (membrane-fusion protein)